MFVKRRRLQFKQKMEQEKKRRRITTQSSSSLSKSASSLPLDLTLEIFSKLPVKSVVRFRCMSKLWSSITNDPYLTRSFENRSSTSPSLLLFFKECHKLFVFSIPHHHQNSNQPSIDCYHIKLPEEYSYFSSPKGCKNFHPTESVHGLICFQESGNPIVWNPSIRKFFPLPKPDKRWEGIKVIMLGYDPKEGKHKVVCFPPYRTHEECRVLTLGSAEKTWRTVKTNHEHRSCRYGRCINGVVYYKAYDLKGVSILMSFDVRTEKFDMIKLPEEYNAGILISYKGRLASVNSTKDGGLKLWILEDAEKHKWSSKYFSALKRHDDKSLKSVLSVKGITDAGEFIFVPSKIQERFYILYFDPMRKSFRKVKFGGTAYDQFKFCNGLLNLSGYALHAMPNHIETVMSL